VSIKIQYLDLPIYMTSVILRFKNKPVCLATLYSPT
jgi:hypothetical protein